MWQLIKVALNHNRILKEADMMTNTDDRKNRSILQRIAHRVMLERGFFPDFSFQALAELDGIHGPATPTEESTRVNLGITT